MPDSFGYDLIDEAIFSLTAASGTRVGLPEALALLAANEDIQFAALRPHQQHPWHAFMVQLAALALHRADIDEPPTEVETWRRLVLDLTDGDHQPWRLVVDDVSQPAFFQPPLPDGSLDGLATATTPDVIDTLVTTRNHDLKTARMVAAEPEHWAFALVSLQTMEGYTGAQNYGIVRMNRGHGSRPAVSAVRSMGRSSQFLEDVAAWRSARAGLVADYGYPPEGGHALLWLLPWDGETAISLQDCDPFFLEICRRIRLQATKEGLVARVGRSKSQRIDPADSKGATGDVWTPIRRADGAVLTLTEEGFSYKLMQRLLVSGDFELGAAAEVSESASGTSWILARGLARGQKTEGYHERLLPIPPRAQRILAKRDERERVGRLAQARVAAVDTVRSAVLRPALCALLQDGAERLKLRDPGLRPWVSRLDRAVDPLFFPRLWEALESESAEAADERWAEEVLGLAEEILEDAIRSLPVPEARRHRAVARAERIFHGAARKRFGRQSHNGQDAKEGGADDAESRRA